MSLKSPQLRIGAVVAVAAVVGFVAWLVLRNDDDGSSDGGTRGPEAISVAELGEIAESSSTPIYWAGDLSGRKIEFTQTDAGRMFVRYLPDAAEVGADEEFLTVGTYPVGNGYGAVRVTARRQGAISNRIEGGGLLVASERDAPSVHFSFPGAGYQVEVFDPSPGAARRLVLDGEVTPVR